MRKTKGLKTRGPGRPREFDMDEALDTAMHMFWEKGYDGTSLGELAAAMGITKPSLYAAFTDKQTLFEQALARYTEGPSSFTARAYLLPTVRQTVEALLDGAVNVSSCSTGPRGCLFTQAKLAQDITVKERAAKDGRRGERILSQRLKKAQSAGEIPEDADCDALALYIKTVALGITVQGASGYSRNELRKVVAVALSAWPSQPTLAPFTSPQLPPDRSDETA